MAGAARPTGICWSVREGCEVAARWLRLTREDFVRGEPRCELHCAMEMSERIQCPFCGQTMELVVDTSVADQRFTTDCEVCCRPFEVFAECEPGEILALDVSGGS